MIGTIYALIPALLTIALVIFTRRVVLSLGIGAISAAFILANFNLIQTVESLGTCRLFSSYLHLAPLQLTSSYQAERLRLQKRLSNASKRAKAFNIRLPF